MATAGQTTGVNAYVSITWGGSQFNVSGDGNRSAMNESAEAPEKTGYQPAGRTRQRSGSGLKDWNFSMDAFWNDDLNSGSAGKGVDALAASIFGEQVELIFGPAGSTSGYRKLSGSGRVTTFNIESPVDGMITASLEVQASAGSLTKATF
jgi:hypothetical protein